MKKRSLIAVLAALFLSTTMMFSQSVSSGNPHGQTPLAIPVTGTFTAPTSGPLSSLSSLGSGTMTGTFNINHFAVQNNASGTPQLVALGNLVATLTNAAGQVQTVVLNNVAAPVDPSGTCPVLSLTLGPLHLNLLGLVVDIPNPINLNIVAQSGPGNLLGNLLCDVTNLLNGGGPLSQVANLLNQVLTGLGL
ncbi:MAG TPA: hypothetical protein VFQ00_12065 [Terriglobales bacterium]|nr:hypothetical protein [Terriglobales bacterium]